MPKIKKTNKIHSAYEKALEQNDTTSAIKHLSKLLTLIPPEHWVEKDSLMIEDAFNLQELHHATSQHEKGIILLNNISPEIKRIYGEDSTEYGSCLFNLAIENAIIGRLQEAISHMEAARKIGVS